MRLLIVAASILSVAVIVGVAGLMPAYVSAWSADNIALSNLAAEKGIKADSGLSDIQKQLNSDQKLLTAVSSGVGKADLSGLIQRVTSVRSTVQIDSFSVSRQTDSSVAMTINGQAPTRADLLSFKSRLEALATSTTVVLPIDELAKSTDVPFTMRITLINP